MVEIKQRSDITPNYYDFSITGEQDIGNRHCFVLRAYPKRRDKFLMNSRVWANMQEFAVVRIRRDWVKLAPF